MLRTGFYLKKYGTQEITEVMLLCASVALCFTREAFILDVIGAWVHGPVVPILYQKYKSYG